MTDLRFMSLPLRPWRWSQLVGWALCLLLPTICFAADDFLDPELAFKLKVRAQDAQQLEMHFEVAPAYYLYREKLNIKVAPPSVSVGELQIPRGKIEYDKTFEKNVELFRGPMSMVLPLTQAVHSAFKLTVGSQGCADQGLCYPPMERYFKVEPLNGSLQITPLTQSQAALWDGAAPGAGAAVSPTLAGMPTNTPTPGGYTSALQSGSLVKVAGAFLLAGLLLSLTPCVLPMLPILSSIIVGHGRPVSRAQGLALASAYALGMAMVYTALGMAAGLAGNGLAAALQNAWALGAYALVLVLLSLSMFGVYELQMPSRLQSSLARFSGRLQGGQYVGVFVMGGASALIVSPCVAAPLAGALVFISHTRDVTLGGVALFFLATGMSVPLLVMGWSAGSWLPRAGGWMDRVKHFFGALLLALALWMVSPVLPSWALMLGIAALLLSCAVYLGAFERLPDTITPGRACTKGLGLVLAVMAALQLAGIATGGHEVWQPLHRLQTTAGTGQAAPSSELSFKPVADIAALDAAVRASTQPVMVDFYADWCVACKELEALTFTDPGVQERLSRMTLLRVDVTTNTESHKLLMRKYQLFGPPALLFFSPAGAEIEAARVLGFVNAQAFREHLDRTLPRAGLQARSN